MKRKKKKTGSMEQSLKSVPVGNSSGDIHLHIAFMPTNWLAMEIPVQHCDERMWPVLSDSLPVEIGSYFMCHRKCLDPWYR